MGRTAWAWAAGAVLVAAFVGVAAAQTDPVTGAAASAAGQTPEFSRAAEADPALPGPEPTAAPAGLFELAWTSEDDQLSYCAAWAGYDGDGDPDLAVGSKWVAAGFEQRGHNQLYRNDAGKLVLAWTDPVAQATESHGLAWADWDGDGDLDLAVGNDGQPNRVYANRNGELTVIWEAAEAENTMAVAWGDYDGDGNLDLAVANQGQPNRVYRNTGGKLELGWVAPHEGTDGAVAWADLDGDGDLDLAAGDFGDGPNRVYRNTGKAFETAWEAAEADHTLSVAWGDWDNDGDPDLAVGNAPGPERVYENAGGNLAPAWTSAENGYTRRVAWGDYDADGDLDLAVANEDGANCVYENTGGTLSLAWTSTEDDKTICVAWADHDGDGDLDLACANKGPNRLYRNMTAERKEQRAMNEGGFTEARLPGMRVASFRYLGKNPESGAMEGLYGWAAKSGLLPSAKMPLFFGFNNPDPKEGSDEYGYECWMTVGEDVKGAGGVQIKTVPGGLYARTGPMDSIAPLWEAFRTRLWSWAPQNGYEYDPSRQWLEEHLTTPEELAGVTPESWRFRWTSYALWVPVKPFGAAAARGKEPRIEERQAFTVMGVQSTAPYASDDFGAVWNEFMSHQDAIRPHSTSGFCYGVNFSTADENVMEYLAGMAVEGVKDAPEGVVLREVPGGTYAVFECTVSAIHDTYEYAFNEWLPSSGRKQDPSRPCFECYDEAGGPVGIYVPLAG